MPPWLNGIDHYEFWKRNTKKKQGKGYNNHDHRCEHSECGSWTDRIVDTEVCKLWDTLLIVVRVLNSIPREGYGQVTSLSLPVCCVLPVYLLEKTNVRCLVVIMCAETAVAPGLMRTRWTNCHS